MFPKPIHRLQGKQNNPFKKSKTRRDKVEIIAECLDEGKSSTLKTHLMYRCNLSFNQSNDYIGFLLKVGLFDAYSKLTNKKLDTYPKKEDYSNLYFVTTEKGISFLKIYREINVNINSDSPTWIHF